MEELNAQDAPAKASTLCCMTRCLEAESNFVNEKPLLQLKIEAGGHWCFFLLKFHRELDPIEQY
jgi:hypothetical protein